jgi:cytoskeletal protein CcmA (bactofilin family)
MTLFGSNARTVTPSASTSPDSTPSTRSNGTGAHHSNASSAANRLSADVSIKGNVSFETELVIDGKVEGDITSTGKLVIGANGKVIGDIEAGSVTIQGAVEGNVLAGERCALQAGGSLQGNIQSPGLVVDENASFIGSATVKAKKS